MERMRIVRVGDGQNCLGGSWWVIAWGSFLGRGSLTIIPNTMIDILWGFAFSERGEVVAFRHFVDLNGTMSEF
jgi:hypothetical protein